MDPIEQKADFLHWNGSLSSQSKPAVQYNGVNLDSRK